MMLSVLLWLMAYPFSIFWSWWCLYFCDWLLTPLVSLGHDVFCTSAIDGLPLWYILVMMWSVLLRLTAYPFGIFWSWCCLYFCDWRLTPLVSFGHDAVCASSIDGLPLWYLLVMMWSVLLRLTAYPFGISWSWCCLYFGDWRLTPLVYFGHDVVCTSSIDGLPLWYLLVMMFSLLLRLTVYPFGIFWSWCGLYFFDWRLTPLISFGHDVFFTSAIDGLPLWYLLVMMLSVLLRLTAYPFGIFWSWCCLYFLDWRLTHLVSFGHDVVCTSSIDGLTHWYLLVKMLSVLRLTAYHFGIFWSWCCLYFFDWRLTPLVSFGHDVVCTSINGLPLWYLLVMMLSVLLRLTAYPFGIFWSWCCLYFFDWRLTPLVSFGHDVVCTSSIDSLPLWYLLVMMLSVLLRLTAYPFGIFWSWCCLYFFDWLLTPLVSFGHDVVCTSSIDGLSIWYLLVMMLSVLLRLTAYPFGIFCSWCCLYFFDLRLTPLVSFGHDVVCTSSINGLPLWYLLVMMLSVLRRLTAYPFGIFWSWCCLYFCVDSLSLWYLLVMMLSVLLRLTAYPFGIFWSWCCLYFFDWWLTPFVSFGHDVVCTSSIDSLPLWYLLVMMLSVLPLTVTPLVSFGHDVVCTSSIDCLLLWYLLVMMLSVLLRLTAYSFGIFWSWCCLYFCDWRLTPLVSFGHDVVCSSSIDGLPFWYLLVMMLSVLLRLTAYPFGIFWSWCCLYFFDWQLTPLVSFGYDVVCTSSIDGLPLWYLLVMMLSVLLRLTAYPFGIFWSWCCLYLFDCWLTPLVSFGHDVVYTSSINGLPLWYLLVMMLSVLLRLTAYPFGIFWSWCCLYFFDWRRTLWYLLVMMLSLLLQLTAYPFGIFWSWCCLYFFDWWLTPLVSFGNDVVCTSSIDGLLLWYLVVMMLSVLLRLTAYPFGISWSWCCLYFFDWRLTPLVSFAHDAVCTSSIVVLPLWYLLVMMLSVLLRLTVYSFGIFWSWCCLYFFDWRFTPLVSCGHDVVCTSSIDGLTLWYLLVMMLSVLRITAYHFGIFWSWCGLYFFDWLLTPLVSCGHDVVCTSSIDGLPLWYLLVMMLSVLLRLTAYPFGIFGHDVVCTSSINVCTSSINDLPLWYLLVMMLSVIRLTAYPFGIFWSWCCLYFDWRLTPLVSFGHDVVCTSSIDCLLLWYLWSWCCLYFFDWRLTPLLSFGQDVVCTSSIVVLPLWYLLVMMLSVLLRLTVYSLGIFWSWCCLYFFDWRLTPLLSFVHDAVCTSSIDGLPLWYLLVMMLSVLLRLTA